MEIRAAEISAILKEQIAKFDASADVAEVGQVISVGDGIRYLPNDSFYSYTVSRDDSQSPVDFLNLSEELEGMMSTSYDDCFNNDDDDGVISNANCIQVGFDSSSKNYVWHKGLRRLND